MAKLRVYRSERHGDDFPPICMRCGGEADAEFDLDTDFTWMPPWVYLFLLAGFLPFLIAAIVLRKSMSVTVPICREHRYHFRYRRLYLPLGFLGWLGVFALTGAAAGLLPENSIGTVLGIELVGLLIWLVVGVVFINSGIRPIRITERFIDLVGADRKFVRRFNDQFE